MRFIIVSFALLSGIACGFQPRELRIASGTTASIHHFNFMIQLLRNSAGNGVFSQECAGVLLTTRHVLTAAHCFVGGFENPSSWQTRAGSPNRLSGGILRNVALIIKHPTFNSANHVGDISVIVVNVPYIESDIILRAWIAPQGSTLPANTVTTIVGWGATNLAGARSELLLQAQVPVWNILTCRANYNQIGRWISDDMICAGENNVGICSGDNGGPLLFNDDVFGIASWYNGCGNAVYPGVFTRVGAFTNWIVDTADAT